MISFSSSQYAPSTTAYPHLNKWLDSLHLPDASLPSSTFFLPTFTAIVSPQMTPFIVPPLPPNSSLLPSSVSSSSNALSILPQDAVATSSHLQHFSAVRQLTRDLQKRLSSASFESSSTAPWRSWHSSEENCSQCCI